MYLTKVPEQGILYLRVNKMHIKYSGNQSVDKYKEDER